MTKGTQRSLIAALAALLVVSVAITSSVTAGKVSADSATSTRQIALDHTVSFSTVSPQGVDAYQPPEVPDYYREGYGPNIGIHNLVNRSLAARDTTAATAPEIADGATVDGATPAKTAAFKGFDGINARDMRLADSGNQFTFVPPDQGLCGGNGFLFESINDAVRVFGTDGTPKGATLSMNQFYGYPSLIVRGTPNVFGPEPTDPSCIYDADSQRWYHVMLNLHTNSASGALTGQNSLDLAVSQTNDPTGKWNIYSIDVTDDGTNGTPDHGCPTGTGASATHPNACLGDYPHIGADANGIYLTSNEYPLYGNGFHGAQVYAISKSALAAGAATITVTQFDTGAAKGNPGFTLWPASSPAAADTSGNEYFLSSTAAPEANGSGSATNILVWALEGTTNLATATLSNTSVTVAGYTIPPLATQKKSNSFPLGQCINDTKLLTTSGKGCWQLLFSKEPAHKEVEIPAVDGSDTRMLTTLLANGKLVGALDTGVTFKGSKTPVVGINYFIITPSVSGGTLSATLNKEGYLAVKGQNVTYPSLGLKASGVGAVGFTLTGKSYFPSTAYTTFDEGVGPGKVITVSAKGKAAYDSFDDYTAFAYLRPRWGDYGYAAVVNGTVYMANEYVASSCSFKQYTQNTSASPLFSCSKTRAALTNWATRIAAFTP